MAEKRMGNQDKLALLEIMEDPTANGSIIITSYFLLARGTI